MPNIINFPDSFNAGDTVQCEDQYDLYNPNDGWVLNYILLNNTNKVDLINSTTTNLINNSFNTNVSSVLSETIIAGSYSLNAVFTNTVSNAKNTKLIKNIIVNPDLNQVSNLDNRFWAEIALENVYAVLQNKATISQKSYEIQNRKLENHSLEDLIKLKNTLESEVNKNNKENGNSKGKSNKIYIKFTTK